MAQTINTNVASLNAQRNLSMTQSSLATSMQRLSSGLRVNSAKDDAAGLAIATRMEAQVRGMNVAIRNANDGISLAQTLEGALGQVSDALQRMRELAVQSANASNSPTDKDSLEKEYGELATEIQRIVRGTTFNRQTLLQTSATLTFQIGANTSSENTIDVALSDMTTNASIQSVAGTDSGGVGHLPIGSSADVAAIHTAIDKIDDAIDFVNSQRATLGATQARFDAVIVNLQVSVENQSAAKGRIMDADFAAETANLSRATILQQAGTAMVAQANQMPQQVLKLLQG